MFGLFDNFQKKVENFLEDAEEFTERDQLITEVELLTAQVRKLNAKLHKQTTPKYVFFHAMLAGIGSAIGATLIAGIVIGVLAQTINRIEDVPIVGNLVKNELIQGQLFKDDE